MDSYAAIDVGNTATKMGLFNGEELIEVFHFEGVPVQEITETMSKHEVTNSIISSVTADAALLESAIAAVSNIIRLTESTMLPIINKYETPDTLGMDRLAAVAGAGVLYAGRNNLVIDAGTCITYDLLNKENEYLGGNISPGLNMRLMAMNHFTGNLPLLEPVHADFKQLDSKNIMATNTTNAMMTGVKRGIIGEIEHLVHELEKTYDKLNVLLTGGDGPLFESWVKIEIFAVPNLVLHGLNSILYHNAPQ